MAAIWKDHVSVRIKFAKSFLLTFVRRLRQVCGVFANVRLNLLDCAKLFSMHDKKKGEKKIARKKPLAQKIESLNLRFRSTF